MRRTTEKRPRARIIRLVIDGLSLATCVFLKPVERGNSPGLSRCTRLDEVRSAVSTSGYASLRVGLSVYIGPRPRSIDTARGHLDLTERRLESGLDENQTFGAIVYSCVSKMQHND